MKEKYSVPSPFLSVLFLQFSRSFTYYFLASLTTRNPMCPVVLSGVLLVRAATL